MSVRCETEVEATPEEVWELLATGEGGDRWLGEPGREVVVESADPPHRLVWWWWDEDGVQRAARAFDLTDLTGGFELTTNDQLGWLVKLLDGRGFNDKYWLFAGPMHAAAPYEAMMEVTDLEQGVTRTYRRSEPAPDDEPPACSVGDIGAFDG